MPTNSNANAQTAIEWLKRHGSKSGRDGMRRYNIPSDRAFGVPMRQVQELSKQLGHDHGLAADLWATGWYEARLLAAYVDLPAAVTLAQMDRWCRDFDNWAVCDTVCFVLFDRTPHAWSRVKDWAPRRAEFVKRARLCLVVGSYGPRQDVRRRAVSARAHAHRARGERRAALREKGGRHGASCRWQAQRRLEYRCQQCCPPPDGLFR